VVVLLVLVLRSALRLGRERGARGEGGESNERMKRRKDVDLLV